MGIMFVLVLILVAAMVLWTLWAIPKLIGALFTVDTTDELLINLGVMVFFVGIAWQSTQPLPAAFYEWPILLPTILFAIGGYMWEHREKKTACLSNG